MDYCGIYLNKVESKVLIPLLVQKIDNIYSFPALTEKEKFNQLDDLGVYQAILARIYSALNVGNINGK